MMSMCHVPSRWRDGGRVVVHGTKSPMTFSLGLKQSLEVGVVYEQDSKTRLCSAYCGPKFQVPFLLVL